MNIRDDASLQAFFNNIGQFDHLQLPAAEISIGAFLDTPIDQVKKAFDSKFFGIYNTAKYAVPYLTQNGSITFFSGAASMRPLPGASALSAVTAAIEGLGRGLAVELAPLRVNTICPGVVDTPLFNMFNEPERVNFFDSFSSQLPIKHVAKAEEIAMAAIFLMKNTYITGTTVCVDGGYTLK